MKRKSWSERVATVLTLVALISLSAPVIMGVAWGINRIVGNNFYAGEGLVFRGSASMDSLHVLTGWGQHIDNDTLKPIISDLDDSLLALTGGTMSGAIDMGDKDIFNVERMECDTIEVSGDLIEDFAGTGLSVTSNKLVADLGTDIVTGEIVAQTIVKANIDTTSTFVVGLAYHITSAVTDSQFMSKKYIDDAAAGLVAQSVKGDHVDSTAEDFVFSDAFRITSAQAESIFITKNHTEKTVHDSLNANWSTWLDGDAAESEIHDSLNVHWTIFTAGENASEADIHDSLYANTPGYSTNSEIHDSLNANWSTWLDGDASESDIHDSLFANTPGYATNSEIHDSLDANWALFTTGSDEHIHDSLYANTPGYATNSEIHDTLFANTPGYITEYVQFWGENDLSITWGTDDSVEVIYPICEKFGDITHPWFVRNINASAGTDDQKDTLVFSGRLPLGFTHDIDSITVPYRTSTTTATTSGIKVLVYAMKDLIGFAPADTLKVGGEQIASGAEGVWDWLTIIMADSSAIGAGSWIIVKVECEMDHSSHPETVDVERPYFWGLGK